jgi:hypothetical protein
VHEQCHQRSVQGGVYLLYLHSFAFKYRYILYTATCAGACWQPEAGQQLDQTSVLHRVPSSECRFGCFKEHIVVLLFSAPVTGTVVYSTLVCSRAKYSTVGVGQEEDA